MATPISAASKTRLTTSLSCVDSGWLLEEAEEARQEGGRSGCDRRDDNVVEAKGQDETGHLGGNMLVRLEAGRVVPAVYGGRAYLSRVGFVVIKVEIWGR